MKYLSQGCIILLKGERDAMKKKNILNLIKYYSENNDSGFKSEAYEIAKYFDSIGDYQLAEYIMALLSDANTFVPQMTTNESDFFEKIDNSAELLLLPEVITQDILGIVNAVSYDVGINKFLLQGAPGTGKTEAVKQIARILEREIYMVDFSSLVDSKLGQTQKNISTMFKEINNFTFPDKIIILFDEIDALALDRTNSNDLREMGRATSTMLKGMDHLNEQVVLIATTNLYEYFDKALSRRFDAIIDFNRYSKEDLVEVAEGLLENYLKKFKINYKNIRLFRKIIGLYDQIPYPGELKNVIKTAVAFSNPEDSTDYMRRLYSIVCNNNQPELRELQNQNFTIREIEILTKVSKSKIARKLKGGNEFE